MENEHTITTGLVLSGGGARGFAHVGVLSVLEDIGAEFDVVTGVSMGAIIGSFYAAGYTAKEIHDIVTKVGWREIVDVSLKTGVFKGERLDAFLRSHLPETFAELKLPFAVGATDIETGEAVFLAEGDLVTAVRASAAFPGAFEPITINGRTLADGGIVNNLPVNAATLLGATTTVASDVTAVRHRLFVDPSEEDSSWWDRMVATVKFERRNPMMHMMLRSVDIMQALLTDMHAVLQPADLRIKIPMQNQQIESFSNAEEIIAEGVNAAKQAINAIGGWDTIRSLSRGERQPIIQLTTVAASKPSITPKKRS